jgi:hypothetical protein
MLVYICRKKETKTPTMPIYRRRRSGIIRKERQKMFQSNVNVNVNQCNVKSSQ